MMDTFSHNSYEQKHAPFYHHDVDDHHSDNQQEELSGWTNYLEDFSNQYRSTHHEDCDHQDKSSCSFQGVSPSLVSDAATDAFSGRSLPVNIPGKLKFGKARAKNFCEDDSLEDTASSPVNSPKVSQFERIQTPSRKIEDYVSSSFDMGNIKGMGDHQIQLEEGDERKMTMGNNNSNMNLRSRGLCVVPISMLANFNGRF